jgi:hypothetical protein
LILSLSLNFAESYTLKPIMGRERSPSSSSEEERSSKKRSKRSRRTRSRSRDRRRRHGGDRKREHRRRRYSSSSESSGSEQRGAGRKEVERLADLERRKAQEDKKVEEETQRLVRYRLIHFWQISISVGVGTCDILVRVRIRGSVPLTNGSRSNSGSDSFPLRMQKKNFSYFSDNLPAGILSSVLKIYFYAKILG